MTFSNPALHCEVFSLSLTPHLFALSLQIWSANTPVEKLSFPTFLNSCIYSRCHDNQFRVEVLSIYFSLHTCQTGAMLLFRFLNFSCSYFLVRKKCSAMRINTFLLFSKQSSFSKLPVASPTSHSFSKPSVASHTSQLILQPFRCFTYVTTHSPNPSFAPLKSQALHLRHLASRPCHLRLSVTAKTLIGQEFIEVKKMMEITGL